VFEGGGQIGEYAGGYSDWVRQRKLATSAPAPAPKKSAAAPAPPRGPKARKLTFKEKSELESLPDRIDGKEREREQLYASLAEPALLRNPTALADARARLASTEAEIATLTARWEELEMVAAGG